jgi:hypothetical protein
VKHGIEFNHAGNICEGNFKLAGYLSGIVLGDKAKGVLGLEQCRQQHCSTFSRYGIQKMIECFWSSRWVLHYVLPGDCEFSW